MEICPFQSTTILKQKLYVVSYCIIIAFHPDLNIPRLIIYRSYDQNQNVLTSLSHFEALENNFLKDQKNFDRTTLKQLEDAAFSVFNREKKYSSSRNV